MIARLAPTQPMTAARKPRLCRPRIAGSAGAQRSGQQPGPGGDQQRAGDDRGQRVADGPAPADLHGDPGVAVERRPDEGDEEAEGQHQRAKDRILRDSGAHDRSMRHPESGASRERGRPARNTPKAWAFRLLRLVTTRPAPARPSIDVGHLGPNEAGGEVRGAGPPALLRDRLHQRGRGGFVGASSASSSSPWMTTAPPNAFLMNPPAWCRHPSPPRRWPRRAPRALRPGCRRVRRT